MGLVLQYSPEHFANKRESSGPALQNCVHSRDVQSQLAVPLKFWTCLRPTPVIEAQSARCLCHTRDFSIHETEMHGRIKHSDENLKLGTKRSQAVGMIWMQENGTRRTSWSATRRWRASRVLPEVDA